VHSRGILEWHMCGCTVVTIDAVDYLMAWRRLVGSSGTVRAVPHSPGSHHVLSVPRRPSHPRGFRLRPAPHCGRQAACLPREIGSYFYWSGRVWQTQLSQQAFVFEMSSYGLGPRWPCATLGDENANIYVHYCEVYQSHRNRDGQRTTRQGEGGPVKLNQPTVRFLRPRHGSWRCRWQRL